MKQPVKDDKNAKVFVSGSFGNLNAAQFRMKGY